MNRLKPGTSLEPKQLRGRTRAAALLTLLLLLAAPSMACSDSATTTSDAAFDGDAEASGDAADADAGDATEREPGADDGDTDPVDTRDADPSDESTVSPELCQARLACDPEQPDDIETFDSSASCPATLPEVGTPCPSSTVCYYCDDPDYDEPYHGLFEAPWVTRDCGPQATWRDITPGVTCN